MPKNRVTNLSHKDLRAIKTLKTEVKKIFGNQLLSVIVYGSRAEGKIKKDSDLDIFLLVKERPRLTSRESNELSRIAFNILEKYNIYPSIVAYGEKEFNRLKDTSYIYWIKRTGIAV